MFITTSMPVGGAETLLANLIRQMDRQRFEPELCCLKERGPLGELLAGEVPVSHGLLKHKYDLRVWRRLTRLLRDRRPDAVVTVGAGDKMFWGRLAAWRMGVPVIVSALHSTGWPDSIGRLNRLLSPITDAFVAVADGHGLYLADVEGLPARKVCVIPNGVDMEQFSPLAASDSVRRELGIHPMAPVVISVAALRPEKNHQMLLMVARTVVNRVRDAHILIVGDGPERAALEQLAHELGIDRQVKFLGCRNDVARLLAASDVFALTSYNEASPVSVLEAMGTGRPVVATNVGSVCELVRHGVTGYLVERDDVYNFANRTLELLTDPVRCRTMGTAGRRLVVERRSLQAMVGGYEQLLTMLYERKTKRRTARRQASPREQQPTCTSA